ncbi:hypothetical protein WR25_20381 [Diploscapter pachys]|uniref:Uncharacterized protein n=1 Tax=Diploscapter pachys TaxID=2018661 RepID=A0A2A2J6J4_9BILA|nr:hypothetical protein WR25_20381 [Diploscapter pachys]
MSFQISFIILLTIFQSVLSETTNDTTKNETTTTTESLAGTNSNKEENVHPKNYAETEEKLLEKNADTRRVNLTLMKKSWETIKWRGCDTFGLGIQVVSVEDAQVGVKTLDRILPEVRQVFKVMNRLIFFLIGLLFVSYSHASPISGNSITNEENSKTSSSPEVKSATSEPADTTKTPETTEKPKGVPVTQESSTTTASSTPKDAKKVKETPQPSTTLAETSTTKAPEIAKDKSIKATEASTTPEASSTSSAVPSSTQDSSNTTKAKEPKDSKKINEKQTVEKDATTTTSKPKEPEITKTKLISTTKKDNSSEESEEDKIDDQYKPLLDEIKKSSLTKNETDDMTKCTPNFIMAMVKYVSYVESVSKKIALEELRKHFYLKPQTMNYTHGIVKEEFEEGADKEKFNSTMLEEFEKVVSRWSSNPFAILNFYVPEDIIAMESKKMFETEDIYKQPVTKDSIKKIFKESLKKIMERIKKATMAAIAEGMKEAVKDGRLRPPSIGDVFGTMFTLPFTLLGSGLMMMGPGAMGL